MTTPNRRPSPAQAEFIRAIVSFGMAEVSAKHLFRPYGICDVESRTLRIVQEEDWVRFVDRPGRGRFWSVTTAGLEAVARLETRCGRCGLTVKRCRSVNPGGHEDGSGEL